jgi:hypothetical protein
MLQFRWDQVGMGCRLRLHLMASRSLDYPGVRPWTGVDGAAICDAFKDTAGERSSLDS